MGPAIHHLRLFDIKCMAPQKSDFGVTRRLDSELSALTSEF